MDELLVTQADKLPTIGASKAAAILGYSPFYGTDLISVWEEIMGLKKPEGEDPAAERKWIGNLLEDDIYELYTSRTGKKIIQTQVKKTRDFLHATIDGIDEDGAIVEAKTSVDYPGELPLYYRVQVLLQMYVHEIYTKAHVAFFGGMYFKIFEVEYNEKEVEQYIQRLKWFYETYVATGICPPKTAGALFKSSKDAVEVSAGEDLLLLYRQYQVLQQAAARIEERMAAVKEKIKALVPLGTKVLYDGTPIIHRYAVKGRVDVDKSLLAERYPEVYEAVKIHRGDYDRLVVHTKGVNL
jgi:predicted phage-related endonuclease